MNGTLQSYNIMMRGLFESTREAFVDFQISIAVDEECILPKHLMIRPEGLKPKQMPIQILTIRNSMKRNNHEFGEDGLSASLSFNGRFSNIFIPYANIVLVRPIDVEFEIPFGTEYISMLELKAYGLSAKTEKKETRRLSVVDSKHTVKKETNIKMQPTVKEEKPAKSKPKSNVVDIANRLKT